MRDRAKNVTGTKGKNNFAICILKHFFQTLQAKSKLWCVMITTMAARDHTVTKETAVHLQLFLRICNCKLIFTN